MSNAWRRWPRIRFIFAQGRGLPMIADRLDKFGCSGPGAPDAPGLHDALAQIRTLYFDTANPSALAATRAMADPGHMDRGNASAPMPRLGRAL
jgi:hypothetical protein